MGEDLDTGENAGQSAGQNAQESHSAAVVRLRRDAAGVLLAGFTGTSLPPLLRDRLRAGLAGVALFGRNVQGPEQVRALTDQVRTARADAVVAIDEEGGDVTRLHVRDGSPQPGNAVLGRVDDEAATTASARAIGIELAAAGCTLDLAPAVDVNSNADNPVIGTRSFGVDAAAVARHSAAWVRGLQSAGVAACAKHFPGHGDTAVDSHHGLPVVDLDVAELRRRELVPFAAAIRAGVATVMTSHILLPELDPAAPATMSRRILTGLLRDELGFEGVIVTDALDMAGASAGIGIPAAAVRALAAGADLLCLGQRSEPHLDAVQAAIVEAVQAGELDAGRLHDAARRVRAIAATGVPAGAGAPAAGVPAASVAAAGMSATAAEAPVLPAVERHRLRAAEVALAFDVNATAEHALAEVTGWTVVRLDTAPNTAAGFSGWGPFAPGARGGRPGDAAVRRFDSWPLIAVAADSAASLPDMSGPVLVIGRDIHRHPHARAVVDGLRARGGAVVVVDMGWAAADRRYADIATFGASAAVGAALLGLLTTAAAPRTVTATAATVSSAGRSAALRDDPSDVAVA